MKTPFVRPNRRAVLQFTIAYAATLTADFLLPGRLLGPLYAIELVLLVVATGFAISRRFAIAAGMAAAVVTSVVFFIWLVHQISRGMIGL